jgi:hypothetical protein
MHVEKALKAIEEWYDGESFEIGKITTDPVGDADDFDQSEHFLSVVGWQEQVGMEGDSFHGCIYFEFEKGKFISTSYWC